MTAFEQSRYPLLEEMLSILGVPLQAMYSTADVARIFGVTPRTIQHRIASGQLIARDLPGRGKFLSHDLEQYLASSSGRARSTRS